MHAYTHMRACVHVGQIVGSSVRSPFKRKVMWSSHSKEAEEVGQEVPVQEKQANKKSEKELTKSMRGMPLKTKCCQEK